MTILSKISKSIISKELALFDYFISSTLSIPTGASITVVAALFLLLGSALREGKKFLGT